VLLWVSFDCAEIGGIFTIEYSLFLIRLREQILPVEATRTLGQTRVQFVEMVGSSDHQDT